MYANADEETRRRDYARLGTSADESGGGAADSAGNAGAEAVNPMMGYATSKADRDALRLHVRAVVPPMGSTEQPISQEFPDLEVNMDGSVEDLVRALAARLGSPKDGAMPYCEAGAVAWTAPHPVDARVLCDGQPLSLETRLRDVPALARAPTDTSSLLVVAFQSPAAHVV